MTKVVIQIYSHLGHAKTNNIALKISGLRWAPTSRIDEKERLVRLRHCCHRALTTSNRYHQPLKLALIIFFSFPIEIVHDIDLRLPPSYIKFHYCIAALISDDAQSQVLRRLGSSLLLASLRRVSTNGR